MSRISQTTVPPREPPGGVDPAELVPLGLVADELGMSRGELAYRHAAEVVVDDLGLRCLPGPVVKRLVADRDAAKTKQLEEVRRRDAEEAARWRPPRGVPAGEGMSAFETMMVGQPPPEWKDRVSPAQEWLDNIGRPVGGR